jgi:hypothetical protein
LTAFVSKLIKPHIARLNAEITAFLEENAYRTVQEPNPDARETILRVVGPDPPLRFSVVAGEVIHQLRSSLDHLLWQLVLANDNAPSHFHQFPISDSPQEYKTARDRKRIKGVSNTAAVLIESCQPYHGTDFRMHPLHILREMDDANKHRLLVVMSANAEPHTILFGDPEEKIPAGETGDYEVIGMTPPTDWPVRATKDGSEVMRIQFGKGYCPELKVDMKLTVQVMFAEFGPLSKQPVITRLQELRDKTALTIDLFSSEFP